MHSSLRIGLITPDGFLDPYQEEPTPVRFDGDAPPESWVEALVDESGATQRRLVASPGSPASHVYALAARHGVDPLQPPACEAEAEAWQADTGIDDPSLEDLTDEAFVTIDNPDSRDLDQALLVTSGEGERLVCWYALADASYYVRPGSALFAESLRRGASVYMPGLVAPMLPRSLCEGLVSLNPEVPRRALVFRMEVGEDGRCRGTEVIRARIRSRAKLSYEGVQAWLDGGERPCADPEALQSLRHLVTLGERRIAEAEGRDVVRYQRREISVRVGEEGLAFVAAAEARNDVERYNEQVSLLANIEGARKLAAAADEARTQPVFRTHEPPRTALLEGFAESLRALRAAHDLPEEPWSWRPGGPVSLAAYVRNLPLGTGPHQGIARAIQRQALRTGGRSGFQGEPGSHFGVGADVYSRFTAPMREVVGIFVHKELLELLGWVSPRPPEEDERHRDQVIQVSQKVRVQQRAVDHECNRLVLDQVFRSDLAADQAPWRRGLVLGLGKRKLYIQLEDPPIEVKLYAWDLEQARGERLLVDAGAAEVTHEGGEVLCRVGEPVDVRVRGMDEERDRWCLDLRPAE
jgi:ribonuclease R